MKNTRQLQEILALHNKWLCGEREGERADLSGWDLRDLDLYDGILDLSEADLSRTVLCGIDLSGAIFSGANLEEANFNGSNLKGANFRGANLKGAILTGANLYETDFRRTMGILRAECGWTDHGECGRTLSCICIDGEPRYFCGCFSGNERELLSYIEKGKQRLRTSRLLAFEFCSARMREMMTVNETEQLLLPLKFRV